ncbi:MAG: response regulator, partial [Nitrospirota bacterium]|nr:response regulator [Nitrospirota bacterium]
IPWEGTYIFCAFIRDIRERKALEENLIRLSSFPKNNPNPVIQTDLESIVTYVNPAAEQQIPGLVVGSSDHPFLSSLPDLISFFLRGGDTNCIVEKGFAGSIFEVKVTYLTESKGITLYVHDVTEQKRAEAALAVSRDEALASVQAKADFLATMSHEIRTPMNGVIGMIGLLLETDLTPTQRRYAEMVSSSGEGLLTIINDILDFSKMESGKLEFETIDFDLRVALEETLELLAEKAAEKKLELVGWVFADVHTAVLGDPGRLRQVLMNLVGNAIKFTGSGEVTVQVWQLEETEEEVVVRFQVSDTGIGIGPETRKRLFQSFSQADSSTNRKFGGTGLGLAISKQLVEQMSGEIGVESQLGKGSLFWFTVRLQKQVMSLQEDNKLRMPLQGFRVCCIDDHPANRFLMTKYCMDWGMDGVEAPTPAEALVLMTAAVKSGKPFDLALVKLEMPGMDGMTLAKTIKADPVFSKTKLVLVTTVGRRGDAALAHDAGFAGYLTKPVRKSQIQACLELILCPSEHESQPFPNQLITKHTVRERMSMGSSRILVADDHTVNQQLAVLILEQMGHRVDVVANGLEAVEALSRKSYDVVMMDCQMPEMDGYAATQEIRRLQCSEIRTPFIDITVNAMQGDRERCLAAGMDDYLSKPIKREELEAVLARWLPTNKDLSEKSPTQIENLSYGESELQVQESENRSSPTSYIDPAVLAEWETMTGPG